MVMVIIEAGKYSGWHLRCWNHTALVQIPASPLIISRFLGKLLKLSVPYFGYQGKKRHAVRAKRANLAKQLEEYLTYRKW